MSDYANLDFSRPYCAYLRKSRADRDMEQQGHSKEDVLDRHRKMLLELAAKMKIEIRKFYSEVVSGDTIEDRPVMQELLRDVENGEWAGVFVVEIERLARGNTKDQGIVAESFKYSETRIITPLKIYDPNDEYDEEYFEFGLFMARREYKTINRRLQRGRIASLKEGNYICSTAPYGYNRVKIPHEKGYTLEINENEAAVVRMVYDWYCNGIPQEDGTVSRAGTESIARHLDTLGIKPRSSEYWSKATINDMLKNPVYYGDVRFGRHRYVKQMHNNTVSKKRATDDNCVQRPGKHPAIIDFSVFANAQEVKAKNLKNTVPASFVPQNPLAGLVYCKKCGHLMTRLGPNSRNAYAALKCPNRYCDTVSSPLFLVEEHVYQFLQDWLAGYAAEADSTVYSSPLDKEIKLRRKALKVNTDEIAALNTQLNKAYTLLEQDVYTVEIFRERQHVLTRDIAALESANKKLSEEIKKFDRLKLSREQFVPKVKYLLETYYECTPEAKNRILKEVIERIDYSKDTPNRRGSLLNANFALDIYPRVPR